MTTDSWHRWPAARHRGRSRRPALSDKAKACTALGVRIIHEPGDYLAMAEARRSCTTGGVGGGT